MNALTHPGFISYFLTNTLSLLGIWILKVGMGWLSWQITQSTFWTSVVSLLLMAPVGLLGPFIAVFVERWDARRAMLATKFMMVVITSAIFVIQLLFEFFMINFCHSSKLHSLREERLELSHQRYWYLEPARLPIPPLSQIYWVDDGIRTHDNRYHKPGLYH